MNRGLTQKIQDDFDRLALYERDEWNHNNHYHQFLLKQLPNKCQIVLDIGCGTGEFSRLLAERADKVTAIDLSPNSIQIAKQRSQQLDNIDYLVADVSRWDFPLEHFDAIVSIATVHHLSIEQLIPKLKAALKPGGVLIVLDLLEHHNLMDALSDAIAVTLNWWLLKVHNGHLKPNPEAAAAMKEHLHTDKYLNFLQAKRIYIGLLKTAKVRRHLFWRYSVVWQKPTA
jgi:ubiquinone/menaquinone biosynthesis C-methylase UbiE